MLKVNGAFVTKLTKALCTESEWQENSCQTITIGGFSFNEVTSTDLFSKKQNTVKSNNKITQAVEESLGFLMLMP
jgi:hypothetical protein